MKTFSTQEPVPAAAITAATMNNNVQPILFTTQYGYRDTDTSVREDVPLKWVIRGLRVTLVRDWNIAQAQITLTTSIPSRADRLPPLPNLYKYRGGTYPYLSKDDEIRIYAGYIDSHDTPICAEMLDERPIDLIPNDKDKEGFKHDPRKPLCPIFWGFIDTIHCVGSAEGGVQLILQCRDRVRVLADTKIVSIPSLLGSQRDTQTKGGPTGRRDEIIYDIFRASTSSLYVTGGDDPGSDQGCWKQVYGAFKGGRKDNGVEEDGGLLYTAYLGAGDITSREPEWSGGDGSLTITPEEDPALWVRRGTHAIMRKDASPRLNLWVQRPPLQKNNMAATFQVYKRSPLEVLMYLASQEERVTDFYASHINGDYIFGPRVLDTSGFEDEHRMYRTYFFRTVPECTAQPLPNQMILSMRSSSTSVASFNRLVVVNPEANGGNRSFLDSVQLTMQYETLGAEKRKVSPPCRTQIVEDPSLSTYINPLGGSIVTALSAARLWGRDIEGVEITVLGDPTLYPSEAIKVWGSVLHDEGTSVLTGSPESLLDREKQQLEVQKLADNPSVTRTDKGPLDASDMVDIRAGMNLTTNKGTDPSGWILPVYKVRLVQHILSTQGGEEGFITRIRAVADY